MEAVENDDKQKGAHMKKLLAILLALTLALTLVPTLAFAQSEDGTEPDAAIAEENKDVPKENSEGETKEEPKGEGETREEPKDERKEESEGESKNTGEVQAAPLVMAENDAEDTPIGKELKKNTISNYCDKVGNNTVLREGAYCLSEDITIYNSLTINGAVTLNLKGHKLNIRNSNIYIDSSGSLTLKDSEGNGYICSEGSDGGPYLGFNVNGAFTMESGCIDNARAGTLIQVTSSGKFIMNGGSIENNKTSINIVEVGDNGTFIMNGGCIANNEVSYHIVEVGDNGTFIMNGGSITGNKKDTGELVIVKANTDGTFCWYGGTIDGSVEGLSLAGTGTTEADPFCVYTAAGLKALRDSINDRYLDAEHQRKDVGIQQEDHVKLMNDIVLNDGTFDQDGNYTKGPSGKDAQPWEPILFFQGTFDGQGHTIRGLYATKAPNMPGAIANYGLISSLWYGTVQDLTVTGYVHSSKDAGGIVGYSYLTGSATIKNCVNYCTVRSDNHYAGGIIGYANKNKSTLTISDCANYGAVTGSSYAGGILGYSDYQPESDTDRMIIQSCLNAGSVKAGSRAGGIAGFVSGTNISLTDCFNTGALMGTWKFANVGGILGSANVNSGFKMESCYSVGAVTATGGGNANGLVGWLTGYNATLAAENCFWLDGTAKTGIGDTSVQLTNVDAKTKAEFANGTVLELLKNNRTDSPWADECKYLAAAGMTLPLFKGQGDSHDHDGTQWLSDETSHWKVCSCGAIHDKADHTGTATCKDKAKCSVCGKEYGALEAHSYSTAWSTDDAEHWHECTVCGAKTDEAKHADTDKDHKCDGCKKVLSVLPHRSDRKSVV